MITFKSISVAAVMLGIALGGCAQADPLGLDEVLARHAEARGGVEAIEAITSVIVDIHIVEPEYDLTGRYYARRDGHMRVDIFFEGERVFTEALNHNGAWSLPGGATSGAPITELEAAILLRGIHGNLFGLHEFAGLGYQVELGERELIDGVSYYTINTTSSDGFDNRYYLDPSSFLIIRKREHSALHPALDPEQHPNEVVNSDFRQINGVSRSFHDEKFDLETGERIQTTDVTELQLNPVIDQSIFVMPQD